MALKPGAGRAGRAAGVLLPMPVWDLATRLFHWTLVVLGVVSYASVSLAGGDNTALWMRVHTTSGFAVLALLLFRILWGLVGSDTARFARFMKSPAAALHHLAGLLRREPDVQIGHNPAGGWMVLILLLLLCTQVGTGLFANDDGSTEGPFAHFVSKDTSDLLSKIHDVQFKVLLAAVILHVAVVMIYRFAKGQDLVRPMLTGKKRLPAATRAPRMVSQRIAAVVFVASAAIAIFVGLL